MNELDCVKAATEIGQPTDTQKRAQRALLEAGHAIKHWRSMAGALGVRVDALQEENRKLRASQGPTTGDGRDAKIVAQATEIARLNRLLDDKHARPDLARNTDAEQLREAYEFGRSGESGGHP